MKLRAFKQGALEELNKMAEKRDPRAHWLDEDPFDQMGLDDIKLDEFEFLEPGPRDHYAK